MKKKETRVHDPRDGFSGMSGSALGPDGRPRGAARVMKIWQEDLLLLLDGGSDENDIFDRLCAAAKTLGFEHCAYGLRIPDPVSNPRTVLLNTYPAAWRSRYAEAGYMEIDPTVLHGRRSPKPLVWSEKLFRSAGSLWEEAKAFGLRFGWAQSSLDTFGGGGMLTLARSQTLLSPSELAAHEVRFRWLTHIGHLLLSRSLKARTATALAVPLTGREIEVLKWTADGKTASEISELLGLSENTVNFHVKNAVSKLGVANKTAAVVRAAMLGMLN
jgi:LuxR family transcriptional regulator